MKKLLLFGAIALSTATFTQVPNYVPTNGLVGWWPFTGNANDLSGNGYNGTVNGATLTADRFGNANQAYSYNGSSAFISVPNPASFSFTNGISISVWAKIAGLNTNTNCSLGCSQFLVSRSSDFSSGHFRVAYDENTVAAGGQKFSVGVNSNGSGGVAVGATAYPYPQTNWQHIVLTFNNSQIKIYVNGALNGTTNYTTPVSNLTELIYFGRHISASYPYFVNGLLDDIGIWNRALTPCEIQNLYYSQVNSLANAGADFTKTCVTNQTGATIGAAAVTGVTYAWTPTTGLSSSTVSNPTANPTTTTTYTVTATNTTNGCATTDQVVVTVNTTPPLANAGLDFYKNMCYQSSGCCSRSNSCNGSNVCMDTHDRLVLLYCF